MELYIGYNVLKSALMVWMFLGYRETYDWKETTFLGSISGVTTVKGLENPSSSN